MSQSSTLLGKTECGSLARNRKLSGAGAGAAAAHGRSTRKPSAERRVLATRFFAGLRPGLTCRQAAKELIVNFHDNQKRSIMQIDNEPKANNAQHLSFFRAMSLSWIRIHRDLGIASSIRLLAADLRALACEGRWRVTL